MLLNLFLLYQEAARVSINTCTCTRMDCIH